MTRLLGRAVVAAIGLYRVAISPLRPPSCRYHPTCSEYAQVAVVRFGLARGGWLAARRLLRCHPWHAGGYDPVPDVDAGPVTPLPRSGRSARAA